MVDVFEMDNNGIDMATISRIMGVDRSTLRRHIGGAVKYGYSFWEVDRIGEFNKTDTEEY